MRTELIGQEYKKNGANYLKINNVKVKYELSDVHIHLDNLFNGDKALGDRMNEFLNENWKALAEEVRPAAMDRMTMSSGLPSSDPFDSLGTISVIDEAERINSLLVHI